MADDGEHLNTMALLLTLEEHLCLRYLLMNVRDELYGLARHDKGIKHYVRDVEYCLKVVRRPGVRQDLTNAGTPVDGPAQQGVA